MANNAHRPGSITKRITCPRCSKKRAKQKKGNVGKITLQIGNSSRDDRWSETKTRTCPACRQSIRFEYRIDEKGKLKIRVLN